MAASITKHIDELEPEQKLLSQLIYRNHNQHGSTQLFSYYKGLSRHLKMLTMDKLNTVNTKCESAIKSSAQTKLSSQDLKQLFEVQYMTTYAVNLLSETIETSLKCADVVRRSLSKKLFLPLYTMLLAITARILNCLIGIHQHFWMQCSLLSSQLQHMALVQPRLEKLITDHLALPSCEYSATTAQILLRVQSAQQADENLHDIRDQTTDTVANSKVSKGGTPATTNAKKSTTGGMAASRNVSTASLLSTGSAMYSGNEVSVNAYRDSDDEDAGLFIGDCDTATPVVAKVSAHREPLAQPTSVSSSRNSDHHNHESGARKETESTAGERTDFDFLLGGGNISSSIAADGHRGAPSYTTGDSNTEALAGDNRIKKTKKRDRDPEQFPSDKPTKKSTSSTVPATGDAASSKHASKGESKEKKGDGKKKHRKSGTGGGKNDDIDDIFGGF